MGAIERIGALYAANSSLEDLGELKTCKQLNIQKTNIKSLGKLEYAEHIFAMNCVPAKLWLKVLVSFKFDKINTKEKSNLLVSDKMVNFIL